MHALAQITNPGDGNLIAFSQTFSHFHLCSGKLSDHDWSLGIHDEFSIHVEAGLTAFEALEGRRGSPVSFSASLSVWSRLAIVETFFSSATTHWKK